MVEMCLNSSYFRFRDKYYQQTFGTAMGSPLSPILADYVMEDLLDTVTQQLSFSIRVLKKYVDDLFLVLPKTEVQSTLAAFNNYDQHLQFTVEDEKDGALPFLDTLVMHHNDGSVSTQWYSKPISSGRLLNYHSFHPTNMKLNVAKNLINRATQLTTKSSMEQVKHKIFQILRQNNYPSALINRLTSHIRNNQAALTTATPSNHNIQHSHPPQQPSQADPGTTTILPISQHTLQAPNSQIPNEVVYKSMPNIPILSRTISEILKREYPSVKIATYNIKSTKTLLKPVKDAVTPLEQHNVIYSIPCTNCDKVYIGMTTNHLKKRISGHRSNVNKHSNTTEHDTQPKTALIQHMLDCQHTFNLDGTKIVDRSYRSSALPMLEMCHIHNTSNTVNFRTDVDGLNITYAGILHTVKTTQSRRRQMSNDRPYTTVDTVDLTDVEQ
ncbi:uncharacterized protein LOC134291828 [Aedes albopictus]|uniref:Reverse transcriptase domain-containing protein n=1 Tax=Aedes albopictus TaxID=7160 RepID=A0ABM1ZXR1_AEDAL